MIKKYFSLCTFVFLTSMLFGQGLLSGDGKNLNTYKNSLKQTPNFDSEFRTSFFIPNQTEESIPESLMIQKIPNIYNYEELAIFCKLEVQMDKMFKMPVRIRLGNLNYVNYLEGKR